MLGEEIAPDRDQPSRIAADLFHRSQIDVSPTADEPRPEPGEGVGLGGDEHGLFTIEGRTQERGHLFQEQIAGLVRQSLMPELGGLSEWSRCTR